MSETGKAPFDFAAFKRAFVTQDVPAWLAFFAGDAEWLEYRHNAPPRAPNRMIGKQEIGDFLARVQASGVTLTLEDEVVGPNRAAFCVWVTFPDGSRIIENIIIHFEDGRITRQVDVEAWD
jgi:ketosteroid isomerase-like protein